MEDRRKGIVVEGVKHADISGNVVTGFNTGIETKHVDTLEMSDNKVTSENEDKKPDNDEHWYKKPIGVLAIAILGGLILWGIKILVMHFVPGLASQAN